MADTPEKMARELWSSLTRADDDPWCDQQDIARLAAALRSSEARGFARGLEASAQVAADNAAYEVRAAILALAPKAPPDVAAAEPKP